METFIQQIINGLVLGSMYALVALGYTMVYGVLRFINFAHGDVFMLGAFAGMVIHKMLAPMLGGLPWGVTLLVVLLLSMAVCAASAEVISIKAKPFDTPVARSIITRHDSTAPAVLNMSCNWE